MPVYLLRNLDLLGVLKWGQMVFLPLPADLEDSNDDEGVLEASGLGIDFCVKILSTGFIWVCLRLGPGIIKVCTCMYPQNLWVFIIFPYLSWYDGHLDPFIYRGYAPFSIFSDVSPLYLH